MTMRRSLVRPSCLVVILIILSLAAGFDRADRLDHMRSLSDSSTGGGGSYACGPGSDWDCGIGAHQGAMLLAYARVYEETGDDIYLENMLSLARTGSTECGPGTGWSCENGYSQGYMMLGYARAFELSDDIQEFMSLHALALAGPSGDSSSDPLRCGPDSNWDCGEGRYQGMMLLGYLKLYGLTGNATYLSYAESLADGPRGSYSCPECQCGPDAGWDCVEGEDQALMVLGYLSLADVTGNKTYLGYARSLAEQGSNECSPNGDWDCGGGAINAMVALSYGAAYRVLGDEPFKEWMDKALWSGSWFGQQTDCGPSRGDFDCGAGNDQGFYMLASSLAFELTGEAKYIEWAERFGDGPHSGNTGDPSACGATTDWDCFGAFDQALFILGNAALDGEFNDEFLLFDVGDPPSCETCPLPGTMDGDMCVYGPGECTSFGCAVVRQPCDFEPFLDFDSCFLKSRCTVDGCVVDEDVCPSPGSMVGRVCFFGEQACSDDGCTLSTCTPGKGAGCDPERGCICTPAGCKTMCTKWSLEGSCVPSGDGGESCACCGVEGDKLCPPGCTSAQDGDCSLDRPAPSAATVTPVSATDTPSATAPPPGGPTTPAATDVPVAISQPPPSASDRPLETLADTSSTDDYPGFMSGLTWFPILLAGGFFLMLVAVAATSRRRS